MKNSDSESKLNPFVSVGGSKVFMRELAKRSKPISHVEAIHRMKEAVAEQKKPK